MFLCKGESETSESEHLHGRKASCDKETYSDSHSSENSDEKKKSNLELLFSSRHKYIDFFGGGCVNQVEINRDLY